MASTTLLLVVQWRQSLLWCQIITRVRGKKPTSKFMAKLEDPMHEGETTSRQLSALVQEMDAYMTLQFVVPDEDKEIVAIQLLFTFIRCMKGLSLY